MLHFPGIWPRPPVDALDSTGPKMDCVFPCTHIPVCVCVCVCVCFTQSCLTLCSPVDCSLPGPLSMEFSRQKHWSGYIHVVQFNL